MTALVSEESFSLAGLLPDHIVKDDGFMDDAKLFKTAAGENVRSKSEDSIANILHAHNLDYVYEPYLEDLPFRPDFIIRNSIRGFDVIWEHFGLLNNRDYLVHSLKKLKLYKEHGYIINKNLIITFELYDDDGHVIFPFDSSEIENIVSSLFEP